MITAAKLELEEDFLLEPRGIVLICDDDADICEALAFNVRQRGFDPLTVQKGSDCVTAAFDKRPAAILLDMNLPDISGLEVCNRLTDSAETSEIPIVMLSASGQNGLVQTVRRAGARFFVRKPYDPNALIAIIEHAIDDAQAW